MAIVCDYHPQKRAHWYCPSCNKNYCSSCAIIRETDMYGAKKIHRLCPHCNLDLQTHSAENIIEPFWRILHKFFAYPFQSRPLILMLILSSAFVIISGPGLFYSLLRFVLWAVLLKYSFCVLKKTATGSLEAPELNMKNLSDNFEIVFKQIAIYLITAFLFIEIAKTAGAFVGILFLLFSFLSIPAMLLVLIATDSLIAALNPMIFVRVAWRIGWGYLLMYFFYVLLGSAPNTITYLTVGHLPLLLVLFISFFAKSYYVIISYHLMGYVLYQYHEDIGYEVEIEDQSYLKEATEALEGDEELIRRANILLREGKAPEALKLIKDRTGGNIDNLQLADLYFRLLKTSGDAKEVVLFGKKYLEMLANHADAEKLTGVYTDCVSRDKNFPLPAPVAFKIAKTLTNHGHHKEAVAAYNRFIKSNPEHRLVPEAYYMAAGIIEKEFGNKQQALKILKGLMKKYPNHGIMPYVKRYVDSLTT